MVRFLLTADWHIGMQPHFLRQEGAAAFSSERLDAVRELARLAQGQGCAFVLACGDLLHSNFVSRATIHRFAQALSEFPLPVLLLPGNHDPLDPATVYRRPEFAVPAHVRVLEQPGVHPVPGAPEVEILAAPWSAKRQTRDLAAAACASVGPAPVGALRILAAHGAADRLAQTGELEPGLVRVAAIEEAIADRRIHFAGLGDRHSTTDLGGGGRVWYPGAPETTAFGEADPGNVLVVTLEAGRCQVDKHRVGRWRFLHEGFDVSGADGVGRLAAWLRALPGKERTAVRVALRGTVGLTAHQELTDVLDRYGDVLADLSQAEESDVAILPDDFDFDRLQLGGYAAATVAALRRQAESGPDSGTAKDALGLLFRLARTGVST